MRIGILATEIGKQEGGAYMGGNVNNIITTSKELADQGHDIVIITTTPRDAAPDPTGDIDWAQVYEHTPSSAHGSFGYFFSFSLYAVRKVQEVCRRKPFDLVTIHSGFSIWGLIGRIVSSTTSCPVAHFQYCPIGQQSGNKIYDTLQRPWLTRRYLTGINKLVGISPTVSESLVKTTGRTDIDTIYPAIDTSRYSPSENNKKGKKKIISYLGSTKYEKGLDLLFESFQQIREQHDCQLKLGLEARFERNKSNLAKRIRDDPDIYARGIIQDVPQFLARSHVFAVPFRSTVGPADYPVAALEAMSCGVPIVATQVGGLRRLVEQSGGGVCIGKPEARKLSSGLKSLLTDQEKRRTMGGKARNFIKQNMSPKGVADQICCLASVIESQ